MIKNRLQCKRCETTWILKHCCGTAKWSSCCITLLQLLILINVLLPHDTALLLLDIYSFKMKTSVHTKTCNWTCIAALFVTAKTGSNPNAVNWGRDEQTMILPFNGLLLSQKKEQTTDMCNNMDEYQRYCPKWKMPNTKGYTLYDFICRIFLQRQNYGNWGRKDFPSQQEKGNKKASWPPVKFIFQVAQSGPLGPPWISTYSYLPYLAASWTV